MHWNYEHNRAYRKPSTDIDETTSLHPWSLAKSRAETAPKWKGGEVLESSGLR